MSCSLWRWTRECDFRPCPGDCDYCSFEPEEEEEEEVKEPTKEELLQKIKEAEGVYKFYSSAANCGGNYGALLASVRGYINGYRLQLEVIERKEKNEH